MNNWIYLTDLAPKATILNPATGELRSIMQSAVRERAPIGLRRYLLEERDGGTYYETGDFVPLTPELLADCEDVYRTPNSWNYDWPCLPIETATEADAANAQRIRDALTKQMADYPYEFEITGIQRRYLMYYSDGSFDSQRRFDRLIPSPEASPFRLDGSLRRKYDWIYNHIMRDAKVPVPTDKERMFGQLRPCLYLGPAWVVRFRLDGQDVLLERCRVYVDDDANFICSDWCQRHDYSTYSNGINLQMGIYTFAGWVTGPCVAKNMQQGSFTPAAAMVTRTTIREAMKKHVLVPAFDDTFAKASATIAKLAKPPVVIKPEAGPITADVMADAMAEAAKIFATTTSSPASAVPQPSVRHDLLFGRPVYRVPSSLLPDGEGEDAGYCVTFVNEANAIGVRNWYTGDDYLTVSLNEDTCDADNEIEYFNIEPESGTGFSYGYPSDDDDDDEPIEDLSPHWWLYAAAVYYRDVLMNQSLPVTQILLEA